MQILNNIFSVFKYLFRPLSYSQPNDIHAIFHNTRRAVWLINVNSLLIFICTVCLCNFWPEYSFMTTDVCIPTQKYVVNLIIIFFIFYALSLLSPVVKLRGYSDLVCLICAATLQIYSIGVRPNSTFTRLSILVLFLLAAFFCRTSYSIILTVYMLIGLSVAFYYNRAYVSVNVNHWTGFMILTYLMVPFGLICSLILMNVQRTTVALLKNKVKSLEIEHKKVKTDLLTGLNNYLAYVEHINTVKLNLDNLVSMAVIDLDFFKETNDINGHDFGNEVLQKFANALSDWKASLKLDCNIFRYGGEEFVIIFENKTAEEAGNCLSALQKQFNNTNYTRDWKQTFSAGIASTSLGIDAWSELFDKADENLYAAKENGRNCIVFTQ